jgi:hypothetical protein
LSQVVVAAVRTPVLLESVVVVVQADCAQEHNP